MDKNDVIFWFATRGKHPNMVDALLKAVDYGAEVIIDLASQGRYCLSMYLDESDREDHGSYKYRIEKMPSMED